MNCKSIDRFLYDEQQSKMVSRLVPRIISFNTCCFSEVASLADCVTTYLNIGTDQCKFEETKSKVLQVCAGFSDVSFSCTAIYNWLLCFYPKRFSKRCCPRIFQSSNEYSGLMTSRYFTVLESECSTGWNLNAFSSTGR